MAQPGTISRNILAVIWLVLGAAMVAVPAWVGWTRWEPVLAGHPALLISTLACFLIGLVALAWSVATLLLGARQDAEDTEHARPRTRRQLIRRARRRIGLAVPALLICVILVIAVGWARPFAATPAAVDAARTSDKVRATDTLTWYEFAPAARDAAGDLVKPAVGFVFVPGARVDPRSYAPLLAPLAAAGELVIVLKEPFGVALADPGHAGRAMAVHPEIGSWVVGGHSVGGTAAASFADDHPEVKGLVLWASYPATALARKDLRVLSVYGSNDALATPAAIETHKADLPPSTLYVAVKGGVHASFGSYGTQSGDGVPGVGQASAQAQVVAATQRFLATFVPPKPKPKPKK